MQAVREGGCSVQIDHFFFAIAGCTLGTTPPDAMVTVARSLLSSSSLRTASAMWRGFNVLFLPFEATLVASSSNSEVQYSIAAARYTAPAFDTRFANRPRFSRPPMAPAENFNPAFLVEVPLPALAFLPDFAIFAVGGKGCKRKGWPHT